MQLYARKKLKIGDDFPFCKNPLIYAYMGVNGALMKEK